MACSKPSDPLVLTPTQIVLGDLHGRNTLKYQPTKLAAMEGLWDTTRGAPMTVFGWPDMAAAKNLYAIDIPYLASVYLTHSWDGEVQGLKAVPDADRPYGRWLSSPSASWSESRSCFS